MDPTQRIGGYRITGKIGEGGMGEVWMGMHPETGAKVAIKTLPTMLIRCWWKTANLAKLDSQTKLKDG